MEKANRDGRAGQPAVDREEFSLASASQPERRRQQLDNKTSNNQIREEVRDQPCQEAVNGTVVPENQQVCATVRSMLTQAELSLLMLCNLLLEAVLSGHLLCIRFGIFDSSLVSRPSHVVYSVCTQKVRKL